MRGFYDELEKVLFANEPKDKISLFESFYADFKAGLLDFDAENEEKEQEKPSYATFCQVVQPEKLYTKIKLDSDDGKARFVH